MSGWPDLESELDAWGTAGRCASFWWRDDDARGPSGELDRLLDLAAGLPVALAAIPDRIDAWPLPENVAVLQHGYAHANYAPAGAKKQELGHRPADLVVAELRLGFVRLRERWANRFLPVLVPPWNRIDSALLPRLPAIGFRGLSAFGPEGAALPGLCVANVHLDPMTWRPVRGFAGGAAVLGRLVAELGHRRRAGGPAGPLGLMTHHLVHDEAMWAFLRQLVGVLRRHPAVKWPPIEDIFKLQ
jgi:hypothetical protein